MTYIHGEWQSPEFAVWNTMLQRCYNEKHDSYKNYGAKGIGVCLRWRRSFKDFLADMGKRPTGKYTLDRKDSTKDYGPENCRWATMTEQNRNRPGYNVHVWRGEQKFTVDEAAAIVGCKPATIYKRLSRYGGRSPKIWAAVGSLANA